MASTPSNVTPLRPPSRESEGSRGSSGQDARFTCVPNGDYTAAFVAATRRKRYGRSVWDCIFKILEGAHTGKLLMRYLSVPEGTSTRSNMHKDFVQIVGLRPPSTLKSMHPKDFYSDVMVVVQVDTVTKNEDGDPLPLGAQCSVIRRVRDVPVGSPPYRQRRNRA